MNIIKSSVSILEQGPGVSGLYEFIEKVGRVSYKSEDRITQGSAEKFVEMLYKNGHWAVFNLGTVYIKAVKSEGGEWLYNKFVRGAKTYRLWFECVKTRDAYNITTDYRAICQLGLRSDLPSLLYDPRPTDKFYRRVTSRWICSLGISQEVLRHAALRPVMESSRYCNYSKNKFSGGLTFIMPDWIEKLGGDIESLRRTDPRVQSRCNFYEEAERQYLGEIKAGLKPEEARGVLPKDTKTEFYLTGYILDWYGRRKTGDENSPEKFGFFNLRTANDTHPDLRGLARDLEKQFKDKNYDVYM